MHTDDEHRLKLPLLPHNTGSDYYPAVSVHVSLMHTVTAQTYNTHPCSRVVPLHPCSPLQGYNKHDQFILAEGPMEMTNFSFLRLMWEVKPSSVVMLCQLEEDGKVRREEEGEERSGRGNKEEGRGRGRGRGRGTAR